MMTDNFDNVNHLVLNFYPDGYSLAVKLNEFPVFTSETILETAKISYEETSLLDYIENEELPPLLVEMIDGSPKLSQYKIWHNGCLILEVRDKININFDDDNKSNNKYSSSQNTVEEFINQNEYSTGHLNAQWMLGQNMKDQKCIESSEMTTKSKTNGSYFILLKPTNLSMLNDVLNLTESNSWSTQDRLQLESQIVLHNSPPLFLEPDATKLPPEQSSPEWPDIKTSSNIYTRHKKELPHTKLKSFYSSMADIRHSKGNGNNTRNNNIYQSPPESLPPELTLQQFLATKRAKKKTFAAGHLARFHRFKKI